MLGQLAQVGRRHGPDQVNQRTRKSIVRTCFYIVCMGNVVTADGYRIEPLGPETWDAFADLAE